MPVSGSSSASASSTPTQSSTPPDCNPGIINPTKETPSMITHRIDSESDSWMDDLRVTTGEADVLTFIAGPELAARVKALADFSGVTVGQCLRDLVWSGIQSGPAAHWSVSTTPPAGG